jgi:hypothetical protein
MRFTSFFTLHRISLSVPALLLGGLKRANDDDVQGALRVHARSLFLLNEEGVLLDA